MKCLIPGANVKILAKAIHSLAKIGDEMYVVPQTKAISFRTVNMAKSAYADFTFYDTYFSYYTFGNLDEDDALKCKIAMRSAMAVFKAPSLLDRQVETCQIRLEPNASKLVFTLRYKNGIIKTHHLPIIDCETLQACYTKDSVPNQLTSQYKVLSDAMHNFQQNLIEITLQVTPQKVLLRNYVDDTSDLSKVIRTQLALGVGEFDQYTVEVETSITFCVKEMRAILSFAEAVSLPVSIKFEAAGRPVIFIIKNPSFEANVVLSTLNPEADSQSESSVVHAREQSVKKRAANKRAAKRTIKPVNRRTINQSTNPNKTTIDDFVIKSTNTKQNKNKIINPENTMRIDPNEDSLFAYIDENVLDITNPAYSEKNNQLNDSDQNNRNKPSCSKTLDRPSISNSIPKVRKESTSSKNTARSIFSTIRNRKSQSVVDGTMSDEPMDEDIVQGSPPRQTTKKARMIFQKCFQTTFDPRMLPGHDTVLAEDSDEQSD